MVGGILRHRHILLLLQVEHLLLVAGQPLSLSDVRMHLVATIVHHLRPFASLLRLSTIAEGHALSATSNAYCRDVVILEKVMLTRRSVKSHSMNMILLTTSQLVLESLLIVEWIISEE